MVATANVQYMKKEAIVAALISNGCLEEELNGMKRDALVSKLKGIYAAKDILDNVEVETTIGLQSVAVSEAAVVEDIKANPMSVSPEATPSLTYNDLGWTDWVLNQLDKSEKFEKYPTCDGLMRIFEIVMGEIISVETKVVQAAQLENHNRATVVCRLTYRQGGSYVKFIEDAADCSTTNTDFPFNNYPSATASTMALGRCLRKAMRLKTLVREEVTSPDAATLKAGQEIAEEYSGATDLQKNLIGKLSKNMGIEVAKLLKYLSSEAGGQKIKDKAFSDLSNIEAQVVMRQLQDYNKDGAIVPDEVIIDEKRHQ